MATWSIIIVILCYNFLPLMQKGHKEAKEADIEEQILLRVPQNVANQIRQIITQRKGKRLAFVMTDDREAKLQVDTSEYSGKLVDLPTHVECHRTFENVTFYKSADISQMLIFVDQTASQSTVDSIPVSYPSGVTPPTQNIRTGRFERRANPPKDKVREAEIILTNIQKARPELTFEIDYIEEEVEEGDEWEGEDEKLSSNPPSRTPNRDTPTSGQPGSTGYGMGHALTTPQLKTTTPSSRYYDNDSGITPTPSTLAPPVPYGSMSEASPSTRKLLFSSPAHSPLTTSPSFSMARSPGQLKRPRNNNLQSQSQKRSRTQTTPLLGSSKGSPFIQSSPFNQSPVQSPIQHSPASLSPSTPRSVSPPPLSPSQSQQLQPQSRLTFVSPLLSSSSSSSSSSFSSPSLVHTSQTASISRSIVTSRSNPNLNQPRPTSTPLVTAPVAPVSIPIPQTQPSVATMTPMDRDKIEKKTKLLAEIDALNIKLADLNKKGAQNPLLKIRTQQTINAVQSELKAKQDQLAEFS